ncbi:hypothetical protein FOXB_00820 [Fusarium oxysporum f. sp. conglutinans Fo5176]|uniref:Uncharacterized protein n=1 Tax=Fusarium oxysporum (strain Fo5176) TaxID=660025 RepID=F9F345_FUSOF|nr:hypothetical protein FOXB_00820 [Fusarium oxysporum f. sp. conglutinans Fo5176]
MFPGEVGDPRHRAVTPQQLLVFSGWDLYYTSLAENDLVKRFHRGKAWKMILPNLAFVPHGARLGGVLHNEKRLKAFHKEVTARHMCSYLASLTRALFQALAEGLAPKFQGVEEDRDTHAYRETSQFSLIK